MTPGTSGSQTSFGSFLNETALELSKRRKNKEDQLTRRRKPFGAGQVSIARVPWPHRPVQATAVVFLTQRASVGPARRHRRADDIRAASSRICNLNLAADIERRKFERRLVRRLTSLGRGPRRREASHARIAAPRGSQSFWSASVALCGELDLSPQRSGSSRGNAINNLACFRYLPCRANGFFRLSLLPLRPLSSRVMHPY